MADNMIVTAMTGSSTVSETEPETLTPVISPNPFGDGTIVQFGLAHTGTVSVTVLDAQGRLIRTLLAGTVLEAGVCRIPGDGRDESGRAMLGGIYLCRVRTDAQDVATRMIALRIR